MFVRLISKSIFPSQLSFRLKKIFDFRNGEIFPRFMPFLTFRYCFNILFNYGLGCLTFWYSSPLGKLASIKLFRATALGFRHKSPKSMGFYVVEMTIRCCALVNVLIRI